MSNFDTAVGATEAALNSEGSAIEENNKRMDSLQGKLTQLDSAWQQFAKNTINSDVIKAIISLGTQLVKLADTNVGRLIIAVTSLKVATVAWNKVMDGKSLLQFVTSSDLVKKTILSMTTAFQVSTVSAGTFKSSMIAASAGVETLTRALLASPLFWVGAATLGIYGMIKAVDTLNPKMEDLKKNTEESTKSYEESESKVEEYKNSLEEINNKIDELAKKGKLTLADEKDLKNLKEEKETLEANLKIEEQLAQIRKQKAQADIVTQYENKSANVFDYWSQSDTEKAISKAKGLLKDAGNEIYKSLGETRENIRWETQDMMTAYSELGEEIEKQEEKIKTTKFSSEKDIDKEKEKLKELKDSYTDLGTRIADNYGTLEGWAETLEGGDKQAQEAQQSIKALMEHIEITLGIQKEQAEEQKEVADTTEEVNSKFEYTNTSIDELQKSYSSLKSAVDEYNNNGYLTVDTLQSLLSLSDEHLSMLSFENGQLVLNTTELDNYTNALVAQRIETAKNAAVQDIWNLAAGNTASMSDTAKAAIANLENGVSTTGATFSNQVKGINEYTQALLEAKAAAGANTDTSNFEQKANAIINSYQKVFSNISKISSGTYGGGGYSKNGSHRYSGTSKGSKSSGTSKSAQSEYKATIDTLYRYNNALDIAKDKVDQLSDALKNTDNLKEQEKITRQLIDALNNQIQKTKELKDAQTSQINDYINQLRQQGFAIDYNNQTNELYINNMEHLADFSGDTAKNLESLIKKIQSLNDNNRSLDSSVRDLTQDTQDYYDQLADFPQKRLEQFKELMEDFQQSQLDAVQDQIDDLEEALKQDPKLKALKEQLEAMKAQTDEKDKQGELEEKMLAVEKAREALENKRNQKTLQVWSKTKGWTYVADPDEIANAKQDLLDAEKDLEDTRNEQNQEALEKQIEDLENSYQDQIDKLQNFLDEQNYQIDKANRSAVQSFEELATAMKKYGIDSAENLSKAKEWLDNYNKSLAEAKKNITTLASSGSGVLYSSDIQGFSTSGMAANISGMSLSGVKFAPTGDTNNSSIYIDRIELPNVSNANEFVEALKTLPTLATAQATSRKK